MGPLVEFERNMEKSIATPSAHVYDCYDVNQGFATPAPPSLASGFSLSAQRSYFPELSFSSNPTVPLADLSSMMFPNPDPFAYPNQQSGADANYDVLLKNLQTNIPFSGPAENFNGFVPPEQQQEAILFQDPRQHPQQQPFLQDADVHLLGPMPMYMMQGASIGTSYHVYEQMTSTMSTPPSAADSSPLQDTLRAVSRQKQLQSQFNTLHANQDHCNHISKNSYGGLLNVNLNALLGGSEWAGLPADRSVTGGFVDTPIHWAEGAFMNRDASEVGPKGSDFPNPPQSQQTEQQQGQFQDASSSMLA
jgi:hypothetical protein